jgi:2,3,4,5-tetrahydropyridine-2-carboxylate N-succinyltransferase
MTDASLDEHFRFFDKNTLTLKKITQDSGVRIVPGGTSIRDGVFLAKGTIIMPPAYINIGSFVDEGTMIDSHALVGSCAQIGKRVHLSAASQIGGVLEPIGALPVIVEDNVFIGGNCGIYEGTVVKKHAVIATGVHITRSTPVYDLVHGTIIRSSKTTPIIIPEGAVVIPGSRAIDQPFAKQHHLSAYAPIIVKYRDASTDAATVLESSLR